MRSTTEVRPRPPVPPAVPEMDPRIRARRIEVRRTEGRRRLRRLVDVALVVAVALGFLVALRTPLLDVDEVRVAGTTRTSAAALVEVAGVARGQQLVDLDLGGIADRVAAVPWIDEATVRRRLDGVVELHVTERRPAAVVGADGGEVVVDAEGRALVRVADAPDAAEGLVRVRGVAGAAGLAPGAFLPEEAGGALRLAQRLSAAAPGEVAEVVLGEDLRAVLTQGGEVRFGDATRLPAKLRSLTTVLEQVDLTCLGELDLRIPASPVLTRREGCS